MFTKVLDALDTLLYVDDIYTLLYVDDIDDIDDKDLHLRRFLGS